MQEPGVEVEHSTINRWVRKYAPELKKWIRPHLCGTNYSRRVDETYIKLKSRCKYLYCAVDWQENTLNFLLCAKREASAGERFLRKTLNAAHTQDPRVIQVDKNTAYPPAVNDLKAEEQLPETTELRQVKYLNKQVEQYHRFIKRLTKPGMGFGSFNTARRTLRGFEAVNIISKGQVQGVRKGDVRALIGLVSQLFEIAQ